MIVTNYIGRELNNADNEAIALQRIKPALLANEPALCNSAWYDYRLLHPTQRTFLYAHYYEAAYRYMIALHVDIDQVSGDNPRSYLPKDDPLGKTKKALAKERKTGVIGPWRNASALWKGRQMADEYGIPYDVFTLAGMQAATGQIWQRVPTPAQLYTAKILDAIVERWADLASQTMYAASDPFYCLDNWQDHPSQQAHAQWLCEQIQARVNPEFALAEYAFTRHQIPAQMLRRYFSDTALLAAKKLSTS